MPRVSFPSFVITLAVVGPLAVVACGVELEVDDGPQEGVEAGATPPAPPDLDQASPDAAEADAGRCIDETRSCGVGACARSITVCGDAAEQTCEPGEPSAEVCDGIDNDCDGSTDEELLASECGIGACHRTQPSCVEGVPRECVAGDPVAEIACDEIDNDCDGSIDEVGPFAPVAVTGFTTDVIAESSPAASSTTGSVDGSNYVLYSVAYAPGLAGLPNDGRIGPDDRKYQLQPYTAHNAIRLESGQTGTLSVVTPAATAAVSILAFSTEGAAAVTVVLDYTDDSTETFVGMPVPDWFTTAGAVVSGFGRTGRSSDEPHSHGDAPYMFALQPVKSCANVAKLLRSVRITNNTDGRNVLVLAVSATGL